MTDKEWVESKITEAKEIIKKCNIPNSKGKIDKTWRSYYSSFGAAIIMGTLPSAVSSFWNAGSSPGEEEEIATKNKNKKYLVVSSVYLLLVGTDGEVKRIKEDGKLKPSGPEIAEQFVKKHLDKDDVLNAAAALKMACDLFEREDA